MKPWVLSLFLFLITHCLSAKKTKCILLDKKTKQPIEGAHISVARSSFLISDERGTFAFNTEGQNNVLIEINAMGYELHQVDLSFEQEYVVIELQQKDIQLKDVMVFAPKEGNEYRSLNQIDIKMRGVNNSQELLRMVPGLFIGQHQGGGKAEQIFIRGFDCDHGTDVNITADGLPVNMMSHAHGQGYADMHFIIPETVEQVRFRKGSYSAEKGDFATAGSVELKTKDFIDKNLVKVEAGMFNTTRGLAMLNILDEKHRGMGQNLYVASEYMYTKGYFDNPQDFNRLNFFSKYKGKLNIYNTLTFSVSSLNSKWNASGQIPDRAISAGLIGWYGAIDPTEGGSTSRQNVNLQMLTTLNNGAILKNQVYYSKYRFDLFSNFTFYLNDETNGDQIRQKEDRDIYGYNTSFEQSGYMGGVKVNTHMGAGFRLDMTKNSELSHTKDRIEILERKSYGDITQNNLFAYLSETFYLSPKLAINTALRLDEMSAWYKDHLKLDEMFSANQFALSPKLNVYYNRNANHQFYLSMGKGFHSNDVRLLSSEKKPLLTDAYTLDLGTIIKPTENLFFQVAIWGLQLNQEFVYVGDEAVVEPSGKTGRIGTDFSMRYAPVKSVYFDFDVNYVHGRILDQKKGEDYIPLAPILTHTGGITYKHPSGFGVSTRYRHLADRPANEDNTIVAKGYTIADMVVSYTKKGYEIGLTANNIFNVKWKETQFATVTRLQTESIGSSVNEICFTPGTPFFLRLNLSYRF